MYNYMLQVNNHNTTVNGAVMFQVEVFWVVTPYVMAVYRHFIGPCCHITTRRHNT